MNELDYIRRVVFQDQEYVAPENKAGYLWAKIGTVVERLLDERDEARAKVRSVSTDSKLADQLLEQVARLTAERDEARAERDAHKREYLDACKTIAEMLGAVRGWGNGPRRGVVEDVQDVVSDLARLRAAGDGDGGGREGPR